MCDYIQNIYPKVQCWHWFKPCRSWTQLKACLLRQQRALSPWRSLTCVGPLQVSGLSMWIGRQLEPMSGLPPWAVTLLACLLVSAVTEFASNPATLTVFLPILSALVRPAFSVTTRTPWSTLWIRSLRWRWLLDTNQNATYPDQLWHFVFIQRGAPLWDGAVMRTADVKAQRPSSVKGSDPLGSPKVIRFTNVLQVLWPATHFLIKSILTELWVNLDTLWTGFMESTFVLKNLPFKNTIMDQGAVSLTHNTHLFSFI